MGVSFGATREFRIMRRDDESQKWSLNLADGCFLVMAGEMQRHYLHGVPAGGENSLRFNITFRCCHPRQPLVELRAQDQELGVSAPPNSRMASKGKGYGKAGLSAEKGAGER